MKNIRFFYLKIFIIFGNKIFSLYLTRHVFVMLFCRPHTCAGESEYSPSYTKIYFSQPTCFELFSLLFLGLIYVVDSADRERMIEAREELFGILESDEMRGVPVVVIANKQDLPGKLICFSRVHSQDFFFFFFFFLLMFCIF